MQISHQIAESVKKAVKEIGLDYKKGIHVEVPTDNTHGDYSTNIVMIIAGDEEAKRLSKKIKNPRSLAETLVELLKKDTTLSDSVNKIEIAGLGFINFYLKNSYVFKQLDEIATKGEAYFKEDFLDIKPLKISLEHTQINPNKGPHVGHLRNACLGDSLVKILKFVGHNVTVQYYQNDIGVQVASIVLAYKKKFIDYSQFESIIRWASKAYVDIEERVEKEQSLKDEKGEIQKRISKQNNEDADLAHKLTDEILKEVLLIFKNLDISYDLIVREGDIVRNELWKQALEMLKKTDVFYKSDKGENKGCWLIKLDDMDDKILIRSNGVPTYVANDLAYELWKFGKIKDFNYEKVNWDTQENPLYSTITNGGRKMTKFNNADSVVNVIDTSQSYLQKSIKEALRAIGYDDLRNRYYHVNYGFVFLSKPTANKLGLELGERSNVKMSGRKGTVVSLLAFVKAMENKLRNVHGKFPNSEEVVKGAIKFEMLKYDTYQDIVFDMEESLSQKGFSAPYIQYTFARSQSVLKRVVSDDKQWQSPDVSDTSVEISEEHINLAKAIMLYPRVIRRSLDNLAPHHLCMYLFELSQLFNKFYASHKILGSPEEQFRLKLTKSTNVTLKSGLSLLGIHSPDSM